MEILIYNDIVFGKLKKQFDKVANSLKNGDFKSADAKKMPNNGYFRAKLDDTNRLLFKVGKFGEKTYLLILEIILNHDYANSRFLNGAVAVIDENKLIPLNSDKALSPDEITPLSFVNPKAHTFNLLDKIISFDTDQAEILNLPSPIIIIGSAGSGKTALTLEKLKHLSGKILYITLSPYLVENARNIYYSFDYENQKQEVEFLSFYEYLSTIEVPRGKEIDFQTFEKWIWRYKVSHKIKDSYKIFEEFKGVITGSIIDKPYLSKEEYLSLGIKQSIFSSAERPLIYDLFQKYIEFLKEDAYFDANITSFDYLSKITSSFDYVVVDEVQDLTNVQLSLIIRSLHIQSNFILCGDSNQIVHPNFFSWAQIKTLFYKQELKGNIIRVLATNYRNTPEVTKIANQLLLIKNARFGSIDKESTYLVESNSTHKGEVVFYENLPKINADLNNRTKRSTKFAVLVLRNEDKAAAKKYFQTPLLFSIQEAKGLEYENVVLFDMISGNEKEFREITQGVNPEDISNEALRYSRGKDKSDKALDEYKFYINSLYVAMTRAVKNLYVIETQKKHDLLSLLNLTNFKQQVSMSDQSSSKEDWQQEAKRLELQGKKEQAEAIRKDILQVQNVPWVVMTREDLKKCIEQALDPNSFNKKSKDQLFTYSIYYNEINYLTKLSELKYRPADRWQQDGPGLLKRTYAEYAQDSIKLLEAKTQKYGLDFRNELNLTPFMTAVSFVSIQIIEYLIKNGAKTNLTDNYGRNALQLILVKAYQDKQYKHKLLNRFFSKLKNESLKIRIDNRLIKIDSHQAEFLMLSYMLSVFRNQVIKRCSTGENWRFSVSPPTFQSQDFIDFFDGLSNQVIPKYRQVRSYISSILSKNEVNREDKYNKKIFVRLRQGQYVPNPVLEILIDEEWINYYDLIDIDEIEKRYPSFSIFAKQIKLYRRKLTENPNAKISENDFFQEIRAEYYH